MTYTAEQVNAALERVVVALAKDATLDDFPDYEAVRIIAHALDERLAREVGALDIDDLVGKAKELATRALAEAEGRAVRKYEPEDVRVEQLIGIIRDCAGWVHAFNTGQAEPGEASQYLDSLPDDLLPDEHFDLAKLRAVKVLSLDPLLALDVHQREDLDRAWDALMDTEPNVVGGLLLRLPPVAVSTLFRIALDANTEAGSIEQVLADEAERFERERDADPEPGG